MTTSPGTSLVPFSNGQFSIRALEVGGEPWFVAADVAKALGHQDSAHATRALQDDEKGLHLVETLRGPQSLSVISEPGLYRLIMRSDKPEARPFQRWVTHDVLPAIRRHGVYSVNAPAPVAVREDKPEALRLLQYRTRAERQEARELEARGLYRNPVTGEILPLPDAPLIGLTEEARAWAEPIIRDQVKRTTRQLDKGWE